MSRVTAHEGARLGAEAAQRLAHTGLYDFEPGLTDAELEQIEGMYGFEFADDHRAFLAAGIPINNPPKEGQTRSRPWPEWRTGDPDTLRQQLNRPIEGILFDVEHNNFWHPTWDSRPIETPTALATARRHLADVPTLVPVYAHRYLPAGRDTSGHPILSIWQTGIIYYGENLPDYINREFNNTYGEGWNPEATVPFWRDLV